jgi:hypothetical protein
VTQILYSNLTDQITSEVLTGEFLLALADRSALPNHPALIQLPDVNGGGSVALKTPQIGLMGYDKMSSTGEVATSSTTALTDASALVTVSRYSKRYEASDLARVVDAHGVLNAQMMAMDAVATYSATLRDLIANLVDNFSTTVGTSGVDGSIEDILDIVATLEIAAVEGPYLGIVHPRQWHDAVKDAALNSGGAVQFSASGQAMLEAMKGLGYKGSLLGVDWFTTLDVPDINGNADRAGGVFGRGALAWAQGPIIADPDLPQVNIGPVLLEKDRTAAAATTGFLMHVNLGAGEQIDAAGVTWVSDA